MGFTRLTPTKPTIAAISGFCLAGGLELALWCDLRIATEGSTLGFPERRWGVPLIDGGTQRLPHVVGLGRALDLILTGRMIDVQEAASIGLVNEVVPAGAHLERSLALAEGLAGFPQAHDAGRPPSRARGSRADARRRPGVRGQGRAGGVRGRRPRRRPLRRRGGSRGRWRGRLAPRFRLGSAEMAYFVTGATGFIGRHLIERLLENRQGKIYVLMRESARGRLEELIERWTMLVGPAAGDRIEPVDRRPAPPAARGREGAGGGAARQDHPPVPPGGRLRPDGPGRSATRPSTWAAPRTRSNSRARSTPSACTTCPRSPSRARTTASSPRRCSTRASGCPPPTTAPSSSPSGSCASSPTCPGAYTARRSWSATRGPARWTRSTGPTTSSRRSSGCATCCRSGSRWSGLDLGYTNIVPVDWVAGALEHIAHEPGLDGRAFHLVDPRPQRVDDVINQIATIARAPRFAISIDKRLTDPLPKWPLRLAAALPPWRQLKSLDPARARRPRGGARAHRAGAALQHPRDGPGAGRHAAGTAAPAGRVPRPPVGVLGARDGHRLSAAAAR